MKQKAEQTCKDPILNKLLMSQEANLKCIIDDSNKVFLDLTNLDSSNKIVDVHTSQQASQRCIQNSVKHLQCPTQKMKFFSKNFFSNCDPKWKTSLFFSIVYLFCENCYRLKAANYFRKNDIVKNDDRLGSKYASVSDLNIFLNRCNTQLKNVS